MLDCPTITCEYLRGKKAIEIPKDRRNGNGEVLELKGATGNNLKNVEYKNTLGQIDLYYRCFRKWKINFDK